MNKKNVIIIMIDGGRLDKAQQSSTFNQLKTKSVFFQILLLMDLIQLLPCMHFLVVHMEVELAPIAIGLVIILKKINSKHYLNIYTKKIITL